VPKKTIYIRDRDVPLWEQAEAVAPGDSISAVLAEALRQYLAGTPARLAWVLLAGTEHVLEVPVEPAPDGWLLAVPPWYQGGRTVVETLQAAGVWVPEGVPLRLREQTASFQVWVPAARVRGLWLQKSDGVRGFDVVALARRAWPLLRDAARTGTTYTYSELGQRLGGLHPLHEVPTVLDVIERWCLDHGKPDLTGVVVSKATGVPGRDYWRQNGLEDLNPSDRAERWRALNTELAAVDWPEQAPF
jgi:hypothetical protein